MTPPSPYIKSKMKSFIKKRSCPHTSPHTKIIPSPSKKMRMETYSPLSASESEANFIAIVFGSVYGKSKVALFTVWYTLSKGTTARSLRIPSTGFGNPPPHGSKMTVGTVIFFV
jgi:hypothetical protein